MKNITPSELYQIGYENGRKSILDFCDNQINGEIIIKVSPGDMVVLAPSLIKNPFTIQGVENTENQIVKIELYGKNNKFCNNRLYTK